MSEQPQQSKLAANILALAAQVLNGDFAIPTGTDDDRLRNQAMRVWRGVDFDAPKGFELRLVPIGETIEGEIHGDGSGVALPVIDEANPNKERVAEGATTPAKRGRRREPAEEA